jgi:hypothetical protein
MFSISELDCASSSGRVLISTAWLGINCAACLSSASAARAGMQRLRTAMVSSSAVGGSSGKSLYGTSARHLWAFVGFLGLWGTCFLGFFADFGIAPPYVAAIDKSIRYVDFLRLYRHILRICRYRIQVATGPYPLRGEADLHHRQLEDGASQKASDPNGPSAS